MFVSSFRGGERAVLGDDSLVVEDHFDEIIDCGEAKSISDTVVVFGVTTDNFGNLLALLFDNVGEIFLEFLFGYEFNWAGYFDFLDLDDDNWCLLLFNFFLFLGISSLYDALFFTFERLSLE
jgi:hypothetical protein